MLYSTNRIKTGSWVKLRTIFNNRIILRKPNKSRLIKMNKVLVKEEIMIKVMKKVIWEMKPVEHHEAELIYKNKVTGNQVFLKDLDLLSDLMVLLVQVEVPQEVELIP